MKRLSKKKRRHIKEMSRLSSFPVDFADFFYDPEDPLDDEFSYNDTGCGMLQMQKNALCGIHSIANGWNICVNPRKYLDAYLNGADIRVKNLYKGGVLLNAYLVGFDINFLRYILTKTIPNINLSLLVDRDTLEEGGEEMIDGLIDRFIPSATMHVENVILMIGFSFYRDIKRKLPDDIKDKIPDLYYDAFHFIVLKKVDNYLWCLMDSNGVTVFLNEVNFLVVLSEAYMALIEHKPGTVLTYNLDEVFVSQKKPRRKSKQSSKKSRQKKSTRKRV